LTTEHLSPEPPTADRLTTESADCDLVYYFYSSMRDLLARHGDHLEERTRCIIPVRPAESSAPRDLEANPSDCCTGALSDCLVGLTQAFSRRHSEIIADDIRRTLTSVDEFKLQTGALFRLLEFEHGDQERFIRDKLDCDPATMWKYVEAVEMIQGYDLNRCDVARFGIARLVELLKFPDDVREHLLRGELIYIDGEQTTLSSLNVREDLRPLRRALQHN